MGGEVKGLSLKEEGEVSASPSLVQVYGLQSPVYLIITIFLTAFLSPASKQ